MSRYTLSHLESLEAESIHVMREVAAEFDNPVMLYSIGKDSSVMVDLARLFVYGSDLAAAHATVDWQLVVAASLAAFAGAFVGSRLLKKVTIRAVQLAVSGLLMLVSLGLIAGAI